MKEELLLPFEPEITPLMQKYIDMAEEAKQIMLQERQAKEQERQAKEEAKQIMLQERQAKERLAAKLKELGIDPETLL
jgi:membrane protein involved in colicin uptake